MESEESETITDREASNSLPFPPLTKDHVLHCSYHYWHPKYRTITPKARLVPLSKSFVSYLKADGIVLPPEDSELVHWDSDSGVFSADNGSDVSDDDDEDSDPSAEWMDVHEAVKQTISELGGKVIPKLNWSSPKDATWINATNSMECRTPNDIYLMLKSSDFVTHDLEHAFDGCVDFQKGDKAALDEIPYHLILRKSFIMNPSVEFRCFVRQRKLIGMCQRDLNHYDFLFNMQEDLTSKIQLFFDLRLRHTFPDENFVFDIYIPAPYDRVWLVDLNPWAIRTDPLLYSWLELLTMPDPIADTLADALGDGFVRLSVNGGSGVNGQSVEPPTPEEDPQEDSDDDVEEIGGPELRLIRRDDPEAYRFNTPQYSAHKLPKDVVDASLNGPGSMREFADQWKDAMARHERGELNQDSDSDE